MQPAMHEDKKNFCEKFCRFFLPNNDLTKNEYKKYNKLKWECLVLFEEGHEKHEALLKDLFYVYGSTCKEHDTTIEVNWKNLGFQVKRF